MVEMPEEETVFVRRASGLVREIGPFAAFSLLVSLIGVGINVHATMDAIAYPGANMPLAFVIAAFPCIITAGNYLMLGVMMPRTGGEYVYVTRSIAPYVGWLQSWMRFWTLIRLGVLASFTAVFWGQVLWLYGSITNNASYLEMASWLQGFEGMLTIGVLLVTLFSIIAILGTKLITMVLSILVAIPMVTSVIQIVYLAIGWAGAPAYAVEHFNMVFGEGAWDKVWTVAKEAGYSSAKYGIGASMDSTMLAAVTGAAMAYAGVEKPIFVGGEIKDPGKVLKMVYIVGTAYVVVYYIFLTSAVWGAYGEFISAYLYAWKFAKGELAAALGTASAPRGILPFFASILAAPNETLMLLICATAALWLTNNLPSIMIIASRHVFAWSFDRFFPELFSRVNDRFGTPHWSIALTAVLGYIGALSNAYSWVLAMIATSVARDLACLLVAMAIALVPYTRPDIWERGMRLTLLGVPLVTILGFLNTFFYSYWFFTACTAMDSLTVLWYAIWTSLGTLIFIAFWAYNLRRGIDPKTIYAEIPPV